MIQGLGSAITLVAAIAVLAPGSASALQGDCAQPLTDGPRMVATDCRHILQTAVGAAECSSECICAPKGTLPVTAVDALLCLQSAVGQAVALACPCGGARLGGFIDSIDIPFVDIDQDFIIADCCKDFGAISKDFIERGVDTIDNAVAGLAAVMNAFGETDVSQGVNDDIAAGEIVLLLDHRDLDASSAPDPLDLALLHGTFAPGTDFAAAVAGNGMFVADSENFLPGTSTPKNTFSSAVYRVDSLSADGGTFAAVLPFGGTTIDVAIQESEIEAGHSGVSATGLGYESATVAGYVFPEDLVIAINGVLRSDNCACLGLTEDIYTKDSGGEWTATGCLADAESLCPIATKRSCIVLAEAINLDDENSIGLCDAIPQAMFLFADLDLDGDTATFEGLSTGIRFTSVPGVISDATAP